MLYARALLLRNCGRFTHVSSDFGSCYHTHTFVTSEALYASLTRGVTWRHPDRWIDIEVDTKKAISDDYFFCDYDVKAKPLWFTPGLFVDQSLQPLAKQKNNTDKNDFNVVDEEYPSTGGKRPDGKGRESYCPTYGRIESILPDNWLFTLALSPKPEELEWFTTNQTFLLGKKRTMVQITETSTVNPGEYVENGTCQPPYLQMRIEDVQRFSYYKILAATARYVLIQGKLQKIHYWKFDKIFINNMLQSICVPICYLQGKIL